MVDALLLGEGGTLLDLEGPNFIPSPHRLLLAVSIEGQLLQLTLELPEDEELRVVFVPKLIKIVPANELHEGSFILRNRISVSELALPNSHVRRTPPLHRCHVPPLVFELGLVPLTLL